MIGMGITYTYAGVQVIIKEPRKGSKTAYTQSPN